jgi:hypothetical protein
MRLDHNDRFFTEGQSTKMSESGVSSVASDMVDFARNAHAMAGNGSESAEKAPLGKPPGAGGSSFSAPAARKWLGFIRWKCRAFTVADLFSHLFSLVMGPAGFSRQQSHGLAPAGFVRQQSGMKSQQVDWRTYLTIEERQAVRQKIRSAYSKSCSTYKALLQTVVAIEEELLHVSAPSRLDYFKSGFDFENRVKTKRGQITGHEEDKDGKVANGEAESKVKKQKTEA